MATLSPQVVVRTPSAHSVSSFSTSASEVTGLSDCETSSQRSLASNRSSDNVSHNSTTSVGRLQIYQPPGGRRAGERKGSKQAVKPTHNVTGYVVKESAHNNYQRLWQPKWFVLDVQTGVISYYKKKGDQKVHGTVRLADYNVCERVKWYDASQTLFTLYSTTNTSARSYTFFTQSKEETDTWIHSIRPFLSADQCSPVMKKKGWALVESKLSALMPRMM
eukprot:comp12413_c1_seq1/m.7313 comp12413_c1_seq1/g.7313  ORF comp12413_c1_seq1/g.7313 comp12413_c1_seq1/m.7313 type:complete len:220 (-) comp12413_c1_seq1:555-1214(-)